VGHIPGFPAMLSSNQGRSGHQYLEEGADVFDTITNGGDLELIEETSTNDEAIQVFRPFKFNVNANYQPFQIKPFTFALIPNLGFAYNPIYLAPWSFEGGVVAEIGAANIVRLGLGIGYDDKLWKPQAYLALNCRVIELDLGVAAQSEDFAMSFQGGGLALNVGLRFGW
jgi:hypothetical protein